MHPEYNRYNLEAKFKEYLHAENIQQASVKQYMSDFRHFIGWLSFEISKTEGIKTLEDKELAKYLTSELLEAYKAYLTKGDTPHKTSNRRLSTVRNLCRFLHSHGILTINPASSLTNVQEVQPSQPAPHKSVASTIGIYKQHLEASKEYKQNQHLVTDIQELFSVIRSQS